MKKIILPIIISTPLVMLLSYYLFLKINYIAVFAALILLASSFFYIDTKKVSISKFEIMDEGQLFNDLNIVILTDLNISNIFNRSKFKQNIGKINSLKPDIIILTGNILGSKLDTFFKKNSLTILRSLKYKYGIFTVFKNNREFKQRKKKIISELNKCNIKLLVDQSILINDEFYLADRYDFIFISSGDGLWSVPLVIGDKNKIINIKIKAIDKDKLNIKIKEILEK